MDTFTIDGQDITQSDVGREFHIKANHNPSRFSDEKWEICETFTIIRRDNDDGQVFIEHKESNWRSGWMYDTKLSGELEFTWSMAPVKRSSKPARVKMANALHQSFEDLKSIREEYGTNYEKLMEKHEQEMIALREPLANAEEALKAATKTCQEHGLRSSESADGSLSVTYQAPKEVF